MPDDRLEAAEQPLLAHEPPGRQQQQQQQHDHQQPQPQQHLNQQPQQQQHQQHQQHQPHHHQQQQPSIMSWKAALAIFVPSVLAFVALDALWIGVVAADFYSARLAPILKSPVDGAAAVASWACIVAINQVFVLPRNAAACAGSFSALGQGALMGVLAYGIVDLTNAALVKGWSWSVALLDIAWGTTACAVLALVQMQLLGWLRRRQLA